ncbi:CSD domain-containing protein [Durusdinium trenchii]|uniref:CSD domain-containing protein n=1 Tax=Durusdinium trenchii TaxID=1381693 RepID=A0ABP0Q0F5_9DINO
MACRSLQVVLFNAEKGYGLIRADQQEGGDDTEVTEVFFAASGLDTEVQVGDRVCYFEDHLMIEGQTCAFNIKKAE